MKYENDDYNAEELSEEGIDRHDEYIENVELDEDGNPSEDIDEYFEREDEEAQQDENEG